MLYNMTSTFQNHPLGQTILASQGNSKLFILLMSRTAGNSKPGGRLTGKLKGGTYKVFISKDGTKYYSLCQAIKHGFKSDGTTDGRKNRKKK